MIVSVEKAKKRMEVCKACKYFLPALHRCEVCGCFMEVKTKLSAAKCPKDLWEKPNENSGN